MSRTPTDHASSFPGWVALASLVAALWLFFANAIPAQKEREELRDLANEVWRLRGEADGKIAETRLARGPNAHQDLQALLVAIDRLGFTPAELCAAYPDRPLKPLGNGGVVEDPEPTADAPPADTPRTKFQ